MTRYGLPFGLLLLQFANAAISAGHFSRVEQLPMQWTFSGTVTWTAPRNLALGFIPFTSTLVLATTALARRGGGGNTLTVEAVLLTAVQILHLSLMWRTVR